MTPLAKGSMCENPVPTVGKEDWMGRRTWIPEILLRGDKPETAVILTNIPFVVSV